MKKIILILIFPLISNVLFAQEKEKAEKLVDEGVAYHDKGDYDGAIAKYDKALELDKNNLLALTEKAYSLFYQQKYEECVKCCEKALEMHPGEDGLKTLYITYGNAFDELKKTDKSIEIYDAGIKLFPDFYQLYFNKGITLSSVKKYDEAMACFQKSVLLNPKHPGSHNAIARILKINNKKIPALLAYSRFLILEPESKRAKENLESMLVLMNGNVEKTGKNSITINYNPDMLGDTTKDGKPKENNFSSADLILSMGAALDYDKKNKKKTEVENFIRKFDLLCSSLIETKKDHFGFYWEYYVPYFTELKDKNMVETFSYIAFASSDDEGIAKWIKSHKSEINTFYEWSKSFAWKTN